MLQVINKYNDPNIEILDVNGDGSTFDIIFDIRNKQVNKIVFYYNWTKDNVQNFILIPYISDANYSDDWYRMTNIVSDEITPISYKISEEKSGRIVFNVLKNEGKLKINLTYVLVDPNTEPNDIFEVAFEEDSLHGKR